jgi:integrase/recombinase XerC
MKEISYQVIRSWVVELIAQKNSNKTVNRKLSSLRGFFGWIKQLDASVQNPMQKIKGLKVGKRIPEFVKENEMNLQREIASAEDFSEMDILIIELFYQTGMRLSELINLKESDLQSNAVKVLGKRNKERVVPISKELKEAIHNWLDCKAELFPETSYLFCTKKGRKLYPKYVYRLVNSYLSKRTSIKKKSPHVLRHTFATHMLNNGAGLEVIKDILGHATLSATQIYTHNTFSKIRSVYKNAHPRG